MLDKETLGIISVVLTLVSGLPYAHHIFKGTIKPHAFSWFIWSILTAIGFAAQLSENAGPGAWSTGVASAMCLSIAIAASFKGERNITRSDWITFIAALSAIPCWVITKDPLWSVILISAIDTLGYYPTFRKSYHKPHEELLFTHWTGALKYVFAIFAIEQLSLTTWLYPASIIIANTVLVLMLMARRKALKNPVA